MIWSYHENGRPDGKTGVIGNPKTIEEFVQKLIDKKREDGISLGIKWGANYLKTLIYQNTLISEIYGWKVAFDEAYKKTMELSK